MEMTAKARKRHQKNRTPKMVFLAQAKNKMFVLQDLRRDGRLDGACEKHWLAIAAAKGCST